MGENQLIFDAISDKSTITVTHPDTGEAMAEVSGYDLGIKFNLDLIKNEEDMDSVCKAMSDMFKQLLIKQILDRS